MIIKIILLLLITISLAHANIPVTIVTSGAGNLATSLDATQCQAYAAQLGSPYGWDGVVDSSGQAVGCSVVEANKKVRYNDRATSGQPCGNSIKCINLAIEPDFYEPPDAEPDPLPDGDWETQDVACGEGNFVSLATNGEFICKSCTEAGQGKTIFLAEFNKKRGAGEGSGVYHGKCCVNGHHKVCQQLLKSYKQNCDDTDKGHDSNRECVAV